MWHEEHVPATAGVADEWSNSAPKNVVVFEWQVSQAAVVEICADGLLTTPTN